jgi:hypothetical protein
MKTFGHTLRNRAQMLFQVNFRISQCPFKLWALFLGLQYSLAISQKVSHNLQALPKEPQRTPSHLCQNFFTKIGKIGQIGQNNGKTCAWGGGGDVDGQVRLVLLKADNFHLFLCEQMEKRQTSVCTMSK